MNFKQEFVPLCADKACSSWSSKTRQTIHDRDKTSLQLMCLFLSGTKHKVTHVSLRRFKGKLAIRQYATWQVELHFRTSSPSDSSASHIMTKRNLNFI